MALQYSGLGPIQVVPMATTALLTNPNGSKTHIRGIVLYNRAAVSEKVYLYDVPHNGGALGVAGADNQWFEQEINPKDTLFIEYPAANTLVNANDAIFGKSDSGNITIKFLGDRDQ